MKFCYEEPNYLRYLYVDPNTNLVHLLVPVMGGENISTDNTCKALHALQTFFGQKKNIKSAWEELKHYQEILARDIALSCNPETKIKKEERLSQLVQYLAALKIVQADYFTQVEDEQLDSYPEVIDKLMSKATNLHSMLLCPRQLDSSLHSRNRVFKVNRENKQFYNALQTTYRTITIKQRTPKDYFINEVLLTLPKHADLVTIQEMLTLKMRLRGFEIDFKKKCGIELTQQTLNSIYELDDDTSQKDYIFYLMGHCANEVWDLIPFSPFLAASLETNTARQERLSLVTQFFLGEVNIYCATKGLSEKEFGRILEDSELLSKALAQTVHLALTEGKSVEQQLFNFIEHFQLFGLKRKLNELQRTEIQHQFMMHYLTIKDAPHFDEFTLLDINKKGTFVSHQAAICIDFTELIAAGYPQLYIPFFQKVRMNYKNINGIVPSINAHLSGTDLIDKNQFLMIFSRLLQPELLLNRLEGTEKEYKQFLKHLFEFYIKKKPATTQINGYLKGFLFFLGKLPEKKSISFIQTNLSEWVRTPALAHHLLTLTIIYYPQTLPVLFTCIQQKLQRHEQIFLFTQIKINNESLLFYILKNHNKNLPFFMLAMSALEESVNVVLLNQLAQQIGTKSLIFAMQNYPDVLTHFLALIQRLSQPDQYNLFKQVDSQMANCLMSAVRYQPRIAIDLLTIISCLPFPDQVVILKQVDAEGYNSLMLAACYSPEVVEPLLKEMLKLPLPEYSSILQQVNNEGLNSLLLATSVQPITVKLLLSATATLPNLDQIAIFKQVNNQQQNIVVFSAKNQPTLVLWLFQFIIQWPVEDQIPFFLHIENSKNVLLPTLHPVLLSLFLGAVGTFPKKDQVIILQSVSTSFFWKEIENIAYLEPIMIQPLLESIAKLYFKTPKIIPAIKLFATFIHQALYPMNKKVDDESKAREYVLIFANVYKKNCIFESNIKYFFSRYRKVDKLAAIDALISCLQQEADATLSEQHKKILKIDFPEQLIAEIDLTKSISYLF